MGKVLFKFGGELFSTTKPLEEEKTTVKNLKETNVQVIELTHKYGGTVREEGSTAI